MKLKLILILLIACIVITGCTNSSVIENTATSFSKTPDEELDALFESLLSGPSLPPAETPDEIFCLDYVNRGLLRVCYQSETDTKIKLQVFCGENRVDYNLKADGSIEDFPLQYGNGEYTARIMQNLQGIEYFAVESISFEVTLEDDTCVFLNSVQNINWNYDMAPIRDIRYIVAESLRNDQDDLLYSCGLDIYGYIVKNIKYDDSKLYDLQYDYLPDIEEIYSEGKGICYDYASLFAAMMRSINIPTKLVKGYADYAPDVYHAWNEVYLKGQWVTVDITRDASLLGSGASFDIAKNSADYLKTFEY